MARKLSLKDRLSVALTGKTKGIIPSLPSDSDLTTDIPLATYATKPEQLRANIGWVFAANRAIVDDVVAVELKVRERQKNGDLLELHDTEFHELISEPSAAHDGEQMRSLMHDYLNLVGESFLLMKRDGLPFVPRDGQLPHSLEVIPAHLAQFKLGETRYSDSKVKYAQQTFSIDEVIRAYWPDPANPYYGRSIVSAAAASIDSDQNMQSWNRRMFANNARPGLIFNLQGDDIDDQVYERLKKQVEELYTQDGVFRSLVVENGEVKPYMLSAQDLDFLASREFTREEILAMWKVPASVLGMSKDYNRANIDGSRYIHMINNVVPRLRREVRMWNVNVLKPWNDSLEVYFDSPVPEDVAAKLNEASKGVDSWMTINEVRELYGMEPLEDGTGDQLYRPINVAPLSSIASPPQTPAGSEGKKGLPKPRR